MKKIIEMLKILGEDDLIQIQRSTFPGGRDGMRLKVIMNAGDETRRHFIEFWHEVDNIDLPDGLMDRVFDNCIQQVKGVKGS